MGKKASRYQCSPEKTKKFRVDRDTPTCSCRLLSAGTGDIEKYLKVQPTVSSLAEPSENGRLCRCGTVPNPSSGCCTCTQAVNALAPNLQGAPGPGLLGNSAAFSAAVADVSLFP